MPLLTPFLPLYIFFFLLLRRPFGFGFYSHQPLMSGNLRQCQQEIQHGISNYLICATAGFILAHLFYWLGFCSLIYSAWTVVHGLILQANLAPIRPLIGWKWAPARWGGTLTDKWMLLRCKSLFITVTTIIKYNPF